MDDAANAARVLTQECGKLFDFFDADKGGTLDANELMALQKVRCLCPEPLRCCDLQPTAVVTCIVVTYYSYRR